MRIDPPSGPRGKVAYVQATSAFTTMNTTATDIPGMTLTVTATTRSLRLTFYCYEALHSVAGDLCNILLIDTSGPTQVAAASIVSAASNRAAPGIVQQIVTPGPGSKTYKVQTYAVQAGTVTIDAAATAPMWFLIEEI